MPLVMNDGNYEPAGYHQLDSDDLNSAVGIPGIGHARVALIQALNQNVRWRDDGVDPTDSVGMVLVAGFDMFYTGDLNKIKFIETADGAEVNITLFKTAARQK